MAEILLQELSNADIDWMVTHGQKQAVAAGTTFINSEEIPDRISLILEGAMAIVAPQERNCDGQSISRLSRGEIVGVAYLLNARPTPAIVKVIEDTVVLSIPRQEFASKLQHDIQFAAHFYRAIARLFAERLRHMYQKAALLQFSTDQPVQEALFVFGEMQDSDIDWLAASGHLEKLSPNNVLLQAGRPVDALYIILDGLFSISIPDGNSDPLSLCFAGLEKGSRSQKVIANLSKGEVLGSAALLDSSPFPVTIRAVTESLVCAISKRDVIVKLQQDTGFAARFYRVIAMQETNFLQSVMEEMGCEKQCYNSHERMDESMEYDDELDIESLHHISQGAARFDWMLRRLGVKCNCV